MRKVLIIVGIVALLALVYLLHSWLQAHALITFIDDSWEIKTGDIQNGFSLLYQAAPIAIFFAVISFLTAGLFGLFFADKTLLFEHEALKNHAEESKERANKAEYNARKKIEIELEASLKSAREREENSINIESELKKQINRVKAYEQELDKKAQQRIEMAEAQYKQELDKKTKAMAYTERKQRRLNKLRERIENEEEITIDDVLKVI